MTFLHAKPWILGGEKSKFVVAMQRARSRTIHEYDVTMQVSRVRVTQFELCRRHNASLDKIVPGENGEMSNRWLF